jgi:hypothetical protein
MHPSSKSDTTRPTDPSCHSYPLPAHNMTTRVASGGGNASKRTMVQPALPNAASDQGAARGPLGSNLVQPSPLRESSVASALGQLNVQDDTEDEGNVLEMHSKL